MFRTLCRICEQKALDAAKEMEVERGVMFASCSHYQVGATCFVEFGEIVDWSIWPAVDQNAFLIRSAAIGVSYSQLKADAGLTDINPNSSTHH